MELLFARLEHAATAAKDTSPYDKHAFELSYGEMVALLQALNLVLAVKSAITR